MVKQPIQKGRGHHRVAHHLRPGFEALVGGDDERDLFIKFADHVEKEIGLPLLDGRVADLVDDNEVRLHDSPNPVFRRLLHLRGLEKLDEVGDALETDLVPFFHGCPSEGDGQVGFPDARRPEEEQVFLGVDPTAIEKVDRLRFADPLDPSEIKILQPLMDREVGAGHVSLDPPLDPEVDLRRKDGVQERQVGDFPRLRVVDHLIEALENALEVERFEISERLLMGLHETALSRATFS